VVAEDLEDLGVHLEVEDLAEDLAEEDSLAVAQVEAGKSILKSYNKAPNLGLYYFISL
jgi:hypothetical protein